MADELITTSMIARSVKTIIHRWWYDRRERAMAILWNFKLCYPASRKKWLEAQYFTNHQNATNFLYNKMQQQYAWAPNLTVTSSQMLFGALDVCIRWVGELRNSQWASRKRDRLRRQNRTQDNTSMSWSNAMVLTRLKWWPKQSCELGLKKMVELYIPQWSYNY